ncbi:MAG: tetratricopeptide repeat protein [Fidelibacterota bacterium]
MHKQTWTILIAGILLMVFFWSCTSAELTSARIYARDKEYEKEEEQLLLAMKGPDSQNPEVYFRMGADIYGNRGEWDKMNEMLDKALALGADVKIPVGAENLTVKEGVERIRGKYWTEFYNRGATTYNEALSGDPELKTKKLDKAIKYFSTAIQIFPVEGKTYKNLLFCYVQKGDQEGINATLNAALKINPDDTDLLLTAGQIRQRENDYEGALVYLEKALSLAPYDVEVVKSLANNYFFLEDYEQAVDAYNRALYQEADNSDLHYNLGLLYLRLTDFDLAEMEFQYVIEADPDDWEAILLIAEAFRGNERWEDAEYYYRQVLDIKPDHASAMRNLAVVVFKQGRVEESQEILNQAKALE